MHLKATLPILSWSHFGLSQRARNPRLYNHYQVYYSGLQNGLRTKARIANVRMSKDESTYSKGAFGEADYRGIFHAGMEFPPKVPFGERFPGKVPRNGRGKRGI